MSCCNTIGEPEWKPHNINVDANPNTITITEQAEKTGCSNIVLAGVANNDAEVTCSTNTIIPPPATDVPSDDDIETLKKLIQDFDALESPVNEWTYYSDGSKYGKRCVFEGQFVGNQTTSDEIKLEHMMGIRFKTSDARGGLPCVAPGDKNYSVPEFSSNFHAEGSTLPAVNFSRTRESVTETFIPLQQLWSSPVATYAEKEKERMLNQEIDEVKALDKWLPAKPMTAGF